jgi:hypothetical protein
MNARNLLIPFALGVFMAAGALAQDCVDYGAGVHVTASLPHGARCLAARGDLVYLSSLRTVDVGQPGLPVDLGAFAGPDGTVRDMVVDGGALYAVFATDGVGSFGGLAIFDLTTPTLPVLIGSVATPGIATAVSVGGGRAYVRNDDGYLAIVDVSSPAVPQLVGTLGGGTVTEFDASGNVVYAFDHGTAMMRVFNVANPATPQLWTTWSEPGVEDVELAFGQLYVFAGGAYRVFGLANPLAPTYALTLPSIDRVVDFHVNQAAAWGFPTMFWDLSNAAAPALLATVPFVAHAGFVSGTRALVGISNEFAEVALGDGSSAGAAASFALDQAPTGLAVLGNHALVIKEMGLDVLDATVCGAPVPVASLLVPGANDGYAVVGDYLYILARSGPGSGIQVVDLRDPAAPVEGSFVLASSARLQGLSAAGSYLYTARGSVIVPIDITDPANPLVQPGVSGLGFGAVAAAAGGVLVSANDWEVRTFSLAQPATPALLGVLQTDLFGRGLLLNGSTACLLHDQGVALFDVADPAVIVPLGAVTVPGVLGGFALAADRLYVEGNGIHVVDIVDPSAPALIGSLPYAGDTLAPLATVGGCLWFAQYVSPDQGRVDIAPLACAGGDGGGGDDPLTVSIDIKPGSSVNPVNCRPSRGIVPVAILTTGTFDALTIDHTSVRFGPGQASEAHVVRRHDDHGRGHARGEDQLVVRRHEADVNCDGNPDLVLHFRLEDARIPCGATSATLTGLTFDGREVTGTDVVCTRGGKEDGGRKNGGKDHGDGECGDKSRGDGDDGNEDYGRCDKSLGVDVDKVAAAPAAPIIAPNPFNPATHVLFSLTQPGRVQVAVYDLSGRRVALVADGHFSAGDQDVLWTGRDDAGRSVSSGVYFVRVDGAGLAASLRAVLLR